MAVSSIRFSKPGTLSKRTQNRLILGSFFAFVLFIGVENQIHMPGDVEAFRNDAYVMRLRDRLRREFLAFQAGRRGTLDVRAGNLETELGEIVHLFDLPMPKDLVLVDGPAGVGRLAGMGHPYLGGRPEKTVWQLTAGHPGGSLELDAFSEQKQSSPLQGDQSR